MNMFFSLMIILSLSFSGHLSAKDDPNPECENVLHWIYKELTLNHLDLSYERASQKFLLSLHQVHKNFKNTRKRNIKAEKIFNTLKKIDPKFKKLLKIKAKGFLGIFRRKSVGMLSENSLQGVMKHWQKLQQESPELFKGLAKENLIDDWDIQTMRLIENVSKYNFSNSNIKKKVRRLTKLINNSRANILGNQQFKIDKLQSSFNDTKQELLRSLRKSYAAISGDYSETCSEEDLRFIINKENYVCPVPRKESDFISLTKQINKLQDLFSIDKPIIEIVPAEVKLPPADVIEDEIIDVPIEQLEYKKAVDIRSTHCIRNPEMVSTIVIHHTATSESVTPYGINKLHLERRTGSGEPWYMIGYNYVISETFQGSTPEKLKVFQGRTPDIKGAHAGGYTTKLTKEEEDFYGKYKVKCGNDSIGYTEESALAHTDENGGISGNLVSYGIAVIGNYANVRFEKINGYMMPVNIHSSLNQRQPSTQTIDMLAKFSCSLQKKNANIKEIAPHQYFKATSCPGSIVNYLNQVATKAKDYGCDFSVKIHKGKK